MIPEERIKEEFEILINERGIHHTLSLSSDAVRSLRLNHKDGKVTIGKMLELLNRANLISLGNSHKK